jgi:hypothetical protein
MTSWVILMDEEETVTYPVNNDIVDLFEDRLEDNGIVIYGCVNGPTETVYSVKKADSEKVEKILEELKLMPIYFLR